MSVVLVWAMLAAFDAGVPAKKPEVHAAVVTEADREVVENLELLESLDEAKELELLDELSVEQ